MIGRIGVVGRGVATMGGGFIAVIALALSVAVAVSSVAPLPADGASVLASAATVGGTKLPDPQTRARNAWASALPSSSRWRTATSAFSAQGTHDLVAPTPSLADAGRLVSPGLDSAIVPRALPSRTYASQAPPLFAV